MDSSIPTVDINDPIHIHSFNSIPEGKRSRIHFQPAYFVEATQQFYYAGQSHELTVLEDANLAFVKFGTGLEQSVKPITKTMNEKTGMQ